MVRLYLWFFDRFSITSSVEGIIILCIAGEKVRSNELVLLLGTKNRLNSCRSICERLRIKNFVTAARLAAPAQGSKNGG